MTNLHSELDEYARRVVASLLHPSAAKLYMYIACHEFVDDSYRVLGERLGVGQPRNVQHHLTELLKMGLIHAKPSLRHSGSVTYCISELQPYDESSDTVRHRVLDAHDTFVNKLKENIDGRPR